MRARTKTGLRLFANVIVVVVLLYTAALLSLRLLGLDYAVVVSNSMQPVTTRGDLVLLRAANNYRVGDVVTFERAGQTVLHRLVKTAGDKSFRTKGDANPAMDPWRLAENELQAGAVGKITGFGWPLLWLRETFAAPRVTSQMNSSAKVVSQVESDYWGTFNFNWVKQLRGFYINASPDGEVHFEGFNDRRLYLNETLVGETRMLLDGQFNMPPRDNSQLRFFLNACVPTSNDLNCGWLISVSGTGAELRVITTGTVLSGALARCTFQTPVDLTLTNRLFVLKSLDSIQVSANAQVCQLTKNASGLVSSKQLPTGGRAGLWLSGNLELDATAFLIR